MSIEPRFPVPMCITPFRIARKEGGYHAVWTRQTARATNSTYEASPVFASSERVRSYMVSVYADIAEVKA
jgi:hypothetical protein